MSEYAHWTSLMDAPLPMKAINLVATVKSPMSEYVYLLSFSRPSVPFGHGFFALQAGEQTFL